MAVASATAEFSEQIFTKKAKSEIDFFNWNGYIPSLRHKNAVLAKNPS